MWPGKYTEKVTFNHSGTEDAPITFMGIGFVLVEEPANTTVWSGTFNLHAKSFIRIKNFQYKIQIGLAFMYKPAIIFILKIIISTIRAHQALVYGILLMCMYRRILFVKPIIKA